MNYCYLLKFIVVFSISRTPWVTARPHTATFQSTISEKVVYSYSYGNPNYEPYDEDQLSTLSPGGKLELHLINSPDLSFRCIMFTRDQSKYKALKFEVLSRGLHGGYPSFDYSDWNVDSEGVRLKNPSHANYRSIWRTGELDSLCEEYGIPELIDDVRKLLELRS